MSYYDDNDDGIRPFDYDEVIQDCRDHEAQMVEVTGDRDIAVGIHNWDSYEFEIWADGGRFGDKTQYFINFEDLREEAKALYTDADWEEVGW